MSLAGPAPAAVGRRQQRQGRLPLEAGGLLVQRGRDTMKGVGLDLPRRAHAAAASPLAAGIRTGRRPSLPHTPPPPPTLFLLYWGPAIGAESLASRTAAWPRTWVGKQAHRQGSNNNRKQGSRTLGRSKGARLKAGRPGGGPRARICRCTRYLPVCRGEWGWGEERVLHICVWWGREVGVFVEEGG